MKQITFKGLSENLVHFFARAAPPLFVFLRYIYCVHIEVRENNFPEPYI